MSPRHPSRHRRKEAAVTFKSENFTAVSGTHSPGAEIVREQNTESQLREARKALELLYGDIREGGLSPSGKFIAVLVPLETARVIRRALKGASDGE